MADNEHETTVEHLRRLATDERIVILTTSTAGPSPALEGRPLTVLRVDDDGTCWFLVDRTADWIDQVRTASPAALGGSVTSDGNWFSASGDATLVEDRSRIDDLWTPVAQAWFDGPDDPRVAALRVRVHTLAWWESADNRLVRLWKMATAAIGSGRGDTGDHGVEQVGP